jgi:hypothetical protein
MVSPYICLPYQNHNDPAQPLMCFAQQCTSCQGEDPTGCIPDPMCRCVKGFALQLPEAAPTVIYYAWSDKSPCLDLSSEDVLP